MGKKFFFSILLFFSLCFTVADSLFGFTLPTGEYVTVPNFCGQRESLLELPDWAEGETSYRYDTNTPAGIVIAQSPAAGSQLKADKTNPRTLTLTVSLGAEEKSVPNVLGQNVREATALLRDCGFAVSQKQAEGGSAGEVIAVFPAVGTSLGVGETVWITVSQCEPAQTVTVPNLTGLSRSSALVELFRQGFSVGEVAEEISDAPEGTVIRQSPAAGSLVAPETKIKLTVSASREASSPEELPSTDSDQPSLLG